MQLFFIGKIILINKIEIQLILTSTKITLILLVQISVEILISESKPKSN